MSKMFKSIKEVVKNNQKQILIIFLVSIGLCLIDQLTKWLAVYYLGPLVTYPSSTDLPHQQGNSVEIIPGLLNFTLLTNNGAAFGLGNGTIIARVIFIIISWLVFLGVPIFIVYYYKKYKHQFSIINLICLILIYGGNFGNLIDRTFYWTNPCGVIDFITKNVLLRPILGTTIYEGNTIEMALYGNSYGQTITYLGWGPAVYLAGRGMGSCFIAEAFHDIGFLGIVLFSVIYGIVLTKVNKLQKGHWIKNAIILIALYHILYAPRDSAGSFISAFFNYSFIVTILIIYFLSKCLKSRKRTGE